MRAEMPLTNISNAVYECFNVCLEPGYYEVGSFGIRLETLVTVVKANIKVNLRRLYFSIPAVILMWHAWYKNALGYRSTAPIIDKIQEWYRSKERW